MIKYVKGDILSSDAQVLVNPVNNVGVMGKGLALKFKNKYPLMFKEYRRICYEGTVKKGKIDGGEIYLCRSKEKWILLFFTKEHWKDPSRIEYIENGLDLFEKHYEYMGIKSIAFPKLGCGNGGLEWEKVKPIMEKYLDSLPITVYVYE